MQRCVKISRVIPEGLPVGVPGSITEEISEKNTRRIPEAFSQGI